MKKTRNAFFAESSFQAYNPNTNLNPYYNQNSYMYQPNYNTNNVDLESRLAKIERQINRLDYRLNKLESNNTLTEEFDTSNSNMYML